MASAVVGRLVFIEKTMNRYVYKDILDQNFKETVVSFGLEEQMILQKKDNDIKHMTHVVRDWLPDRTLDIKEEDDDKDDIQAFSPPTNYITISQGKIQLVHQQRSQESDISDAQNRKDRLITVIVANNIE
ncbi:unnamed protein product [Ceratitis capitata]|uniref:(Mediterranean fruit fly) hypothetical protein n=1 Tax=Ceratitis capitata TaxID=7213 RepID=A0A811VDU8_CERCA|nr:unnamed protein product [Ceratitis capitata]